MALGHEGVGVVQETGPDVKWAKKGDRVGWGYEHDSCGICQNCFRGEENYCHQRAMYGDADLDQGSFAHGAVWREAFLFKIPDALSDVDAAPLQCGGATVFDALRAYDAQPTETVGVMGVGGLGHLAIQFAAKMGCKVVVLSGSDAKKDEAMQLGATEFIAMKGAKEIKPSRPLDRLLVTTSAQPDWDMLLPIMAPGATIHPISVSGGNLSIPYSECPSIYLFGAKANDCEVPLILKGIRVQGSVVAPRHIHNDMLNFAALHGIKPILETFPMTEKGIEEAMEKLNSGSMRYRGVVLPQN